MRFRFRLQLIFAIFGFEFVEKFTIFFFVLQAREALICGATMVDHVVELCKSDVKVCA